MAIANVQGTIYVLWTGYDPVTGVGPAILGWDCMSTRDAEFAREFAKSENAYVSTFVDGVRQCTYSEADETHVTDMGGWETF